MTRICKHCGRAITPYVGNIWNSDEPGWKNHYCKNTDPEKPPQLHVPHPLTTVVKAGEFDRPNNPLEEAMKQYPILDLTKNHFVAVTTSGGLPHPACSLWGNSDLTDLQFNVFNFTPDINKERVDHKVLSERFYFDQNLARALVSGIVMRMRHPMWDPRLTAYFGNCLLTIDNLYDDRVDVIYGVNSVLAILDHFGPDAPYNDQFANACTLVNEVIKEVTPP